jgi:hypothetical protein
MIPTKYSTCVLNYSGRRIDGFLHYANARVYLIGKQMPGPSREAMVGVMFESAKTFWPDLTWEQFEQAGYALFSRKPPTYIWTLQELNDGLMSALTERYGPPVR